MNNIQYKSVIIQELQTCYDELLQRLMFAYFKRQPTVEEYNNFTLQKLVNVFDEEHVLYKGISIGVIKVSLTHNNMQLDFEPKKDTK